MKKATKILYILLALGIGISIVQLFTGSGGSGLSNFIDSIHITSIVIFLLSLIVLAYTFKKEENRIALWIILVITLPLSARIVVYQTSEIILSFKETTTPENYQISQNIEIEEYSHTKYRLINIIDSLIKVGVRHDTAKVALRYFDGKQYNDNIERDWAIDLPHKMDYRQIYIDTIFYNPSNQGEISGILITKAYNQYLNYPTGGIEYLGKGFVYNTANNNRFKFLKYTSSGNQTYSECSRHIRKIYLKIVGKEEGQFNLNDKRFWN